MSKAKQQAPVETGFFSEPISIEDAAYRSARIGESTKVIAQYVLNQCPTILEGVPKEIKAKLYAGFQLRKHEITPPQFYRMGEHGEYILVQKPEGVSGLVEMSINLAMAHTQQAYSAMRGTDPAMHKIIGPYREAFSNYASERFKVLLKAIADLTRSKTERKRATVKPFTESLEKMFEDYQKRCRVAADARQDSTADEARYNVARKAFWTAYNA